MRRQQFYSTFTSLVLVCLVVIVVFRVSVVQFLQGYIEQVFIPIQRTVYASTNVIVAQDTSEVKKLQEENQRLVAKLANQQALLKENQALRDQFEKGAISAKTLLPAVVIGSNNAFYQKTMPTIFTIDKGSTSGVRVGQALIVHDMLIGKVMKVSQRLAVVASIFHKDTVFPAKTQGEVLGIVKADGNTLMLENVVLSEKLVIGDNVVTKGDVSAEGVGYPPNILIGKILSVQKTNSALFQTAEVRPAVDLKNVSTVFVITHP